MYKTIPHLLLLLALALVSTVLVSGPAQAHAVGIFAYVEGDTIHSVSKFSDGKPARDKKVIVSDAETGEVYLKGRTGQQGEFSFPVPKQIRENGHGLKLLLKAGLGHQDEWLIDASEF